MRFFLTAFLLSTGLLVAEVKYESQTSAERMEVLVATSNELLERVNEALRDNTRLLEKIYKEFHPTPYDNYGRWLMEDE